MSQQGPILIVSNRPTPSVARALTEAKVFPVIDTDWAGAADAVARVQPAAIIVAGDGDNGPLLAALAHQTENLEPLVPVIAVDPQPPLPANVQPFSLAGSPTRIATRLNAVLRTRLLHATVLRRLADEKSPPVRLPENDPLQDATVLLLGRGGSFPALSIVLGEQSAVVGALSIEAAAKHLNSREIDGIVIGEGFTPRVVDAFLMVLSEDPRFRNLPIVLSQIGGLRDYDLPNLEITAQMPQDLAASALPLIRLRAFESRLHRVLKSIDVGGLLDPRTGLLTEHAFHRDLAHTVTETLSRGTGLALAKFSFPAVQERSRYDAARILSRLMRRMDFATLSEDGTIIAVFTETDLRTAQMIARRLTSVMKQTVFGQKRTERLDPDVTVTSLRPRDTVDALLARLDDERERAVS
ncbi:MAG: GGDEF domain-containing protein [Afipia sp.]